MTDPDKPAFHVVDRRRSAQSSEAAAAESQSSEPVSSGPEANVPAGTFSTDSAVNPAASQDEEATPLPFASTSFEAGDDAMPMPDPGALLAYVAMQMDVRTLASTLLGVFAGQAWQAMGLVANPVTGQTEKNLPDAQIAIDCVQFLLGKVDADLSAEERREIHRRLNDLRVNYLAKVRES